MAVFESLIQMMVDSGAYYVFIWLLFASIMYGMLQKYEIFGDPSVKGGASLGASLFTLLGIYVYAPEGLFLNFAAAIGFALLALFGTIILLSISGVNVTELGDEIDNNTLAGAAAIIVLVAFFGALAFNLDWTTLLGDSLSGEGSVWEDVLFPIIFLLFLLLTVGAMTDN